MIAFTTPFISLTQCNLRESPFILASNTSGIIVTPLTNMNIISQSSWCPAKMALTVDALTLSDQIFKIGTASAITSYTFTDFTYSYSPACTDTTSFTYKATLSGGVALPSFIQFSSATKTFSWSTATSSNSGVYTISVAGYIGNA